MSENRSPWQILLGAVGLLLVVAAGYVTAGGLSSLNNIDQSLAMLTERLSAVPEVEPTTQVEPSDVEPPSKATEQVEETDVVEVTVEPGDDTAPTITSTAPSDGDSDVPVDADIAINFSEDVTLTDSGFDITCDSSGAHTASASGGPQNYTLDPELDFDNGESCTVKVFSAQVADTDDSPDNMAGDFSFSFDTVTQSSEDMGEDVGIAESINVLLPGTDDTLILSKEYPKIQIRLENVLTSTQSITLENVQVQLLVPKRKLDASTTEPLNSTYVATATRAYTIAAGSGVNVTLQFGDDNLPATGEYEAWLIVTSDNGKPRSKVLTLEVMSDPQDKPGDESIAFVLPNSSPLIVSDVSQESRGIRVGIESLMKADTLTIGEVELLILKRASGGSTEILTPGIAATGTHSPGESPLKIEPGEVEYVTFTFDKLPASGTYEAWLRVAPEQGKPVSQMVNIDVFSSRPENQDASVKVRLPSDTNPSLVLSNYSPAVPIRLENLEDYEIDANVQLLVAQKKESTGTTPLSPGYASRVEEVTIPANQALNVELSFEGEDSRLPPSGNYEAWLLVTGEKGKLLAQTLDLDVSTEPLDTFQHRLTAAAGQDKVIIIGGIRRWPTWLNWLFPKALSRLGLCRITGGNVNCIHWDDYELALWEKSLRENPKFAILASELANDADGRSGWLNAVQPEPFQSDRPSKAKLFVEDVEAPGEYKGNLTLVAPDGEQKETINVIVRLRDALWQPFVVIVLGALVLGWLLRHTLGDTSQNISFQRYQIAAMRERLRQTGICISSPSVCFKIQRYLRNAEVALATHDFRKAERELNKAENKLQGLEEEAESTRVDQAIEVKPLGRKDFYKPAVEPVSFFTDEMIYFKAAKRTGGEWSLKRKRRLWRDESLTLETGPGDESGDDTTVQYTFSRKGRYELKYGNQILQLKLDRNPVQSAVARVKWNATLAALIWAGVAGVAGLILIETSLPTFGSPQDYLAVLAFGLGIGTASLPVESVVSRLQEYWAKLGKPKTQQKETLPSEDELKGKTGAEVEDLLEELGFTDIKFEPKKVDKAEEKYVSMKPEPGTLAELDQPITVTLEVSDGDDQSDDPNRVEADPPQKTTGTSKPSSIEHEDDVLVEETPGTGRD